MKVIYQDIRYHDAELEGDSLFLIDGPTVLIGNKELVMNPTDEQWNEAKEAEPIPIYNETDLKTLFPGLYLGLFHGREVPDKDLDDWGSNGPIIGPLLYVHTTYAHKVTFCFASVEAHDRYFPRRAVAWRVDKTKVDWRGEITQWAQEEDMDTQDDLLVYRGKYYGDWSAFIAPDCAL